MILTKPKSISAGPSDGTGEGVAHSKRWYVAMVRMHHEKKVAERLDKMGIENFVPVQQEIHQWSDRRKKVEAVLGIVERESRDARLVGVCRNVSVGNAASYPDDALAGVVTLGIELAALADQLHDPGFVPVGDREGFAARSVAVGVGQIHDDPDRFAGSLVLFLSLRLQKYT